MTAAESAMISTMFRHRVLKEILPLQGARGRRGHWTICHWKISFPRFPHRRRYFRRISSKTRYPGRRQETPKIYKIYKWIQILWWDDLCIPILFNSAILYWPLGDPLEIQDNPRVHHLLPRARGRPHRVGAVDVPARPMGPVGAVGGRHRNSVLVHQWICDLNIDDPSSFMFVLMSSRHDLNLILDCDILIPCPGKPDLKMSPFEDLKTSFSSVIESIK